MAPIAQPSMKLFASFVMAACSGLVPASKDAPSHELEERLASRDSLRRSGGDDTKLPGSGCIRPSQDRRRHQDLICGGVRLSEALDLGDAMRPHCQMNGSRRERCTNAAGTKSDFLKRSITSDHRDYNLSPFARRFDRRRSTGTRLEDLGGLLRCSIKNNDVMSPTEKTGQPSLVPFVPNL